MSNLGPSRIFPALGYLTSEFCQNSIHRECFLGHTQWSRCLGFFGNVFGGHVFLERIYTIVNEDFLGVVAIVADDDSVDRGGRALLYMSLRPL